MASLNSYPPLRLTGPLTLPHAESIQASILDALDAAPAVSLDLSAATEIDTSFLQILIAANKAAAQMRVDLSIAAGSGLLEQAAFRCGMALMPSPGGPLPRCEAGPA